MTLSFDLAPGYSLSDAVTGIQQASDAIAMPQTVQGSFQGTADAFQQSMPNMPRIAADRDPDRLYRAGHPV